MRFVILSALFLAGCSDMSDVERQRLKASLQGMTHQPGQMRTATQPRDIKMRCTQYHWGTRCKSR